MIVSSFSSRSRFPLYQALALALALFALLAVVGLWGSIESQAQFDAVAGQLLERCGSARDNALCQLAEALDGVLAQRIAVMLLLQGLCCALIVVGAGLLAHRGYHVLVRRAGEALELCPPAARERGRDEVDRLIESLAEFNARETGAVAAERWQEELAAEQFRRNGLALHAMHEAVRMFGQDDISETSLQQGLQLLETALGARSVGLRLHGGAREALSVVGVVATHGEPRLMAHLASAAPATRDSGARAVPPTEEVPAYSLVVPLARDGLAIGTLVAEFAESVRVDDPHAHLAESFARLAALALSGVSRGQEERRVVLMEERSAIAAELHDSLAQSLAFMKIQVARLQSGLDREAPGDDVRQAAGELREGLSAAYHEVRELIAAFRVRMGPGGLRTALQEALDDFAQRSGLEIRFEDRMGKCQLGVNEEFHVLQLVREAVANAVRHARAEHVWVDAHYSPEHQFTMTVDDDGGGLSDADPARSHYGLTIMRERARSLGGTVTITPREGGGTRVQLRFAPQRFPSREPDNETSP